MNRIAALLSAILVFTLVSIVAAEEEGGWAGADEKAEEAIGEIAPHYEPWFSPIWEPPSGEIESFLFSLQSAIGALIIGYFLGYYKGKKVQE
ncbi:cobalt transport protein [Geoglobus ahangari]|uniref:Cobalt transport protein CbiN n=1 Tax=Geoglobus ahangari TaxID=113653 RepID=A0A0F7IE99_9EURY|nr:energy-coupling factor ABC transporter substrate-binding protein [Geoglobus ahangari]AKG91278.1 cobalt transport protein [Geoglobus ahangari]